MGPTKFCAAIACALLVAVGSPEQASAQTLGDMLRVLEGVTRTTQHRLEPGADSRATVSQAQSLLNALGYDAGPVDGLMGNRTRAAISAFQRDSGLSRNGQPDAQTMAALQQALHNRTASRAGPSPATEFVGHYEASSRTASAITGDITVAPASITFGNGATIGLRPLDYPGVFAVDPPADPELLQGNTLCGNAPPSVVMLEQTDPAFLELSVFFDTQRGPQRCASYNYDRAASAPASPGIAVIPGGEIIGDATLAVEETGQWAPGDRPPGLERVQQLLGALGYDAGVPDGVMGSRTRLALAEFQAARGLGASGRLDAATIAALREAERGGETQSAHAPTAQGGQTITILGVTIAEPASIEIPIEWHQVRAFVPEELLVTPAEPLTEAQVAAHVSAMQAERLAEYERGLDLVSAVAAAANPDHEPDFIRFVIAEWATSPPQQGEVIGDMRADVAISDRIVLRPEAQVLAKSLEIERLAKELAALSLIGDEFGPAGVDPAAGMQAQTTPAAPAADIWTSPPADPGTADDASPAPSQVQPGETAGQPRVATARPIGPEITNMIDGLAFHDGRPRDHRQMNPAQAAFQNLLHLALIGQRPQILEDRARASTYGRMFLPQSRQDALFTGSRWKGDDEFELARTFETFLSEDAPRLIAAAPALPLPVVLYGHLRLMPYSAELGGFPVNSDSHTFALRIGNREVRAQFAVPDLLPTANAAEAEALARKIESGVTMGSRVLHVAAWATIHSIGPEVHDITYRLERLVAYSEAEWTRVVHEFPLSQAPLAYLHDPGTSVAPAGQVRIDYETVFLATLAAESDAPGGIDWPARASQRWDLERRVYGRDQGSRWHDYDPWGPFFPISGGDFAATAVPYWRWTQARAAALPETLVLDSVGYLQSSGQIQETNLSIADGIPAVAPQLRPGALANPGIDRRGTHVPAYRRSSDYEDMVRQTVGGSADRLVVIGEGGEGGLLFPRPVTEYLIPVDQTALHQAARGVSFEVHLSLERGAVQRLEAGGRSLTVLHVAPMSAEVRIGGEIVAVAEFETGPDIPYGEPDLAAAAPVGSLALDPEALDLLFLRHLDDEVSESDWTRMFVGRWALEEATPDNEEPAWGRFFRYVAHEPDEAERARLMPQFRTWTRERVAMLPERFRLTLPREKAEPAPLLLDPTLRGAVDIAAQYDHCVRAGERVVADNERLAENVPKACDFIRVSGQLQEPYTAIARSHAGLGLRASCQLWTGPAHAYCSKAIEWHRRDSGNRTFNEMFALSQQVVEPLPAGGLEVQHIVFELSVEGARIAEEFPRSRYGEARDALAAFQRETGAMLMGGSSWAWASPNVPTPVPVFDIAMEAVSVQDAETGEELARLAVAPIEDLPLDMLVLPASDFVDRFDIIGIKLGMDFEEAEALIREHMEVGRVVVADRRLRSDTLVSDIDPYTSGKILVSKDGNELFALYDEPPAATGKVVAMWRRFHLPKGQILPADFLRSVVARYGEPGWRETHERAAESGLRLVWSDTLVMESHCLGFEELIQSGVWFEDGLPTDWYPPGKRQLRLPIMGSDYYFRPGGNFSETTFCDAHLGTRYVTSTAAPVEGHSAQDDEITVWLRDHKMYRELLNESRRIGPVAADADEESEAGPAVEIRF